MAGNNYKYYEKINNVKKYIIVIILSFFILVIGVMLPTTKEIAIIYFLSKENVKELPDKIINLANEWIEELKFNKNKK